MTYMERLIAGLMGLLMAILPAQGSLNLSVEDGWVTGEMRVRPVAWEVVPGFVDTYTIDMPEPVVPENLMVPTLEDDLLLTQEQAEAGLALLEAADAQAVVLSGARIKAQHGDTGTEPMYDYTRMNTQGQDRQAEMARAVRQAEAILDALGIAYEKPFLSVMRLDALAASYQGLARRGIWSNYESNFLAGDVMASMHTAKAYAAYAMRLPTTEVTMISARFAHGGLPCYQHKVVTFDDGSYITDDMGFHFTIGDDGTLHSMRMEGGYRVVGETPFTGTLIPWQEAVAALLNTVVARDMDITDKATWERRAQDGGGNGRDFKIVEARLEWVKYPEETRPAWIVVMQYGTEENLFMMADGIVDAQTGAVVF